MSFNKIESLKDDYGLEHYRKEHKKLELLLSVTRNISRELEINKLLMLIMDQVKKALNCDRCTVFILDAEKGELWSKVAHGEREIRFPSNMGIAGYVASSGKILNIKDVYKDDRFNPNIDKKTGYITRNMLNAPLRNKRGEIIGVFQTLNKHSGSFNKEDEELLSAIAVLAASQIENAQLYEEQVKTFDSFIETLASTIDARDSMTAGHSRRIARYADEIAKIAGLSESERKVLRVSSLLHDFGKIAIREAVLTKDGRLSDEEYAHMKQHTVFTKSILERINFSGELKNVPQIAAAHHENVDGTGYPDGLCGDEIPLLSKIISIADVVDALTSRRHYRDRMEVEKVMEIIDTGTGVKFDVRFIQALKKIALDDFINILEEENSAALDENDLNYFSGYSIQQLLDEIGNKEHPLCKLFDKYYSKNYLKEKT